MPRRKVRSPRELLEDEKGTVRKRYGSVSAVLVYPNTYYLGMSNLGFQRVYELLNRDEEIRCERAFFDPGLPLRSLEEGRTLGSFDIIAFSIPFELDYPNVLEVLRRAKIPIRSSGRNEHYPLIMAGGPTASLNPVVLSDFIDVFIVGEAEAILPLFLAKLGERRGETRSKLLEALSALPGVYVPAVHRNGSARVRRIVARDLSEPASTVVLTRHTEFGGRFLVEIGRGCPFKCHFCAVRWIYRPVRFFSATSILEVCARALGLTRKIGLLGSAVMSHPDMERICIDLVALGAEISTSSVRADSMTPALMRCLAKSGQRTLTIAPESGSDELRERMGKAISNDSIVRCAQLAREHGIRFLKLYYIIGFPGETDDDVAEIAHLTDEISRILPVKVSIKPLVPKPHTSFERLPMASRKEIREKVRFLRDSLSSNRRVRVLAVSVRSALLETLFSRGDRRVGEAMASGKLSELDPKDYIYRRIPDDEPLPWEIVSAP